MNPLRLVSLFGERLLLSVLILAGLAASAQTPPSVTSEPAMVSLATGADLVLAPVLTGDTPTSSQWFRNGEALPGATGTTLTVNGVTAATAGYYTVTFANDSGWTTAGIALVQIDEAPPAPDVSPRSFRLRDYVFPRIAGAEWLYSGVDARNGQTIYTRVRMADLASTVTAYSGRFQPYSYATTTLALDGTFSLSSDSSVTPLKSWTDFMTADDSGVATWGDDYVGGESARLDGGVTFPTTMRLGQTSEHLVDYYEHGTFAGQVRLFLQLEALETVVTPAGRFDGCLRLKLVMVAPGNVREYREWWAAGLGRVRKQWISGDGLQANSRLIATTFPADIRYRLTDYFLPLQPGTTLDFTGANWSNNPAQIRTRLVNLAQNITTYTGGATPTPASATVVSIERASTRTDIPSPVTDTWFEYYTTATGLALWGNDDDPGTQEARFENGLAMPTELAVGESGSSSRNCYLFNGTNVLWLGPTSFTVALLGVETATEPAGTFANALHLRFTLAYAGSTEVHDEWLAPGVGSVRYRTISGAGHLSGDLTSWVVPDVPSFSNQSTRVSCALGGTADLAVLAVGTGPLEFQWYRGETGDISQPLSGAQSQAFTTPALVAWTRYWVRVSNAYGAADSATMLVMPMGGTRTHADWSLLDDLPNNQRGTLNTPAGDGVTNLMKFALGLTPMASATTSMPRPVIVSGMEKHLALRFARNAGAQGVRYVLETSTDLATWSEVTSDLVVIGTAADGRQNVRLVERAALATGVNRRFARLKIASP